MESRRFGGQRAGREMDWVIQFSPQGSPPEGSKEKPGVTFYIPAPRGPPESELNLLLDTQGIEKIQHDYANFLQSISKLCSILEKEGIERSEDLKKIGQDSQVMDSALQNLSEIIRKFNEMLKKLRNEGEEGPKN
ncbi:hypothetical protein [Estrella lausannensis]|uniref:Uncharacterized protein n=1 Tax=Estrella lausannensis TaxID=483423 RepID=A0A0H5DPH1_9BACT|nr:hypothetical protein [Estrella lausannensis]CRX37888.1 hypothetical protein ELAC_0533 [Estrella lausannensis]